LMFVDSTVHRKSIMVTHLWMRRSIYSVWGSCCIRY
jgi:hypothetical protein